MAKIKKNSAIPKALGVRGITLYPYIFIGDEGDDRLINHELIHIEQQRELWVVLFYILYVAHWLRAFSKLGDFKMAYYEIPFEKEAYANDDNLEYLKTRQKNAWKGWVNNPAYQTPP
jgi:hypothetical protein